MRLRILFYFGWALIFTGCNSAPPERTAADDYLMLGNSEQDAGRYYDAIGYYSKAIALNPVFAVAYAGRAEAKIHRRDYKGAVEDAGTAIKLNPNLAPAYVWRAMAKIALEQLDDALADLNKALALDSGLEEGHVTKAFLAYLHGNLKDSSAEIEKIPEEKMMTMEAAWAQPPATALSTAAAERS